MGSKTFGVYLAKWRHPSWKWPVRHSVAAATGKCKLSNIYTRPSTGMICMAASRPSATPPPPSVPILLLLLPNAKWKPIRSGISFRRAPLLYRRSREIRESGNVRLCREIVFVRGRRAKEETSAFPSTRSRGSFPSIPAVHFAFGAR